MTFSLQTGYTPLMLASVAGHVECVKLLLARGAQTNHQNMVGYSLGMDTGLLERCDDSMGENPSHQLGGMGEHCKLTIEVWGRVPQTFSGWSMLVMR